MSGKVFFAFFDAQMKTYIDRKNYQSFIKGLKAEGFLMLQKSVYVRYMAGSRSLACEAKRIRKFIPGSVKLCLLALSEDAFRSMAWLNCSLPDIVQKDDIICI